MSLVRHRLSVLYGDSDDEEKDVATRLARAIAKEKEDKKHAEKAMPLYVWVPAVQVPSFWQRVHFIAVA